MHPAEAYRFGPFVLDTARMALMQGDRQIELRPKGFETLLVLLRHSGRVVGKDELVAAVWPHVIVNDDALAQCVRDVRKALADTDQSYIRTVSRRGYMFVHHVIAAAARTRLRSVAVLPFEADGQANSYLADGLREATTNGLAQLPGLRVAPRTSLSRSGGSTATPWDIGRELGVEAVVTASVTLNGERLRVQVDLVAVDDNTQVWGSAYQGSASELVHVQGQIVQDLARALDLSLSEQETGRLARQITGNSDAYRAYLQGRHGWSQRSEDGLRRAMERFQHAIEIDPRFAAAHAGLADCYVSMGKASYIPPAEAFPAARSHATRALELDPSLCEPLASLGFVRLYFEWDWSAAEAKFQRAVALDPDYSLTREWYSVVLLATGRKTEGLREIQRALRLDPLSVAINSTLAFHHYHSAKYDEAVKQFCFALELSKEFPPAHYWLGRTYQEMGRFEEALAEFEWLGEEAHRWPVAIAARAFVAAISGRKKEALANLVELKSLESRRFVTSYSYVLVYAGLGEADAAFASLDKAFEERSNWLVWLRHDPRLKSLRSDPRFEDLVRRIGFPPGMEDAYSA